MKPLRINSPRYVAIFINVIHIPCGVFVLQVRIISHEWDETVNSNHFFRCWAALTAVAASVVIVVVVVKRSPPSLSRFHCKLTFGSRNPCAIFPSNPFHLYHLFLSLTFISLALCVTLSNRLYLSIYLSLSLSFNCITHLSIMTIEPTLVSSNRKTARRKSYTKVTAIHTVDNKKLYPKRNDVKLALIWNYNTINP